MRPDLAPALAEALGQNRSVALPGSNGEVFINMFAPATRLVIVGAVHVAQEVLPALALDAGTAVVVLSYDPKLDAPRS